MGIECDKIREPKLVPANVSAETGELTAVICSFLHPHETRGPATPFTHKGHSRTPMKGFVVYAVLRELTQK